MKNILFLAFFTLMSTVSYWHSSFNFSGNKDTMVADHSSCMHDHFGPHIGVDTTSEDFFPTISEVHYPSYFATHPKFRADGFDFPVGIPNGTGYYKALNFGDKRHLGEDWNGKGGGNTDLGDPVHAAANGLVVTANDICCGWGNVVRIIHKVSDDPLQPFVETVYAHLHTVQVKPGDLITRGTQIGTIGTAKGRYKAHLHLEMRDFVGMSLGPGYSDNQFGYLDPTAYIQANRP